MANASEQSAHLLQHVVDNLSTTVLLFDATMRLRFVNPAGEMLFANSARHLLGMHARDLLPADDVTNAIDEALTTGHPFTKREIALSLPPERHVTVDLTLMPCAEPGQPRELLVELIQVDRQLRISRDEVLLAQQQGTRELLRGLAHEVKNPLGGLRGAAQLLERELPDPSLKEYTQVIIGEADRLQNLVDRLLGPSGLPQKRACNIHEVLERVRNLVRAEAGGEIRIQRDYDPSIPELCADPDLLIQALLNIVRNAVQALRGHGTITLRTRALRQFTIATRRHRLVVCVDVIDDGPGITPEMKERMFYPMVTGRADGTGLGLSIAQSLIQQHAGLIECSSRPGHTVFSILLPLDDTPREEAK